MAKWLLKRTDANVSLMASTLKISEDLARVLANRGIRTKHDAIKFLNPSTKFFGDSSEMKDMELGVQIIKRSIESKEKIAIYGDYDVDGVTATAILFKSLKALGANVGFYIPHREEDGYGLTKNAIERLHLENIDCILCCDNGISAVEEVSLAKSFGMKVVIIDHHEPSETLPIADAIIDPKQESCTYPFELLCAGGLCYKFSKRLFEAFETDFSLLDDELLVLAMIATFCDVVDLFGENRIIAKTGLKILNENKKVNRGLWHLLHEKEYDEKVLNGHTMGFIVGPCINASGRLESAKLSVELFTHEGSDDEVIEIAKRLVQLNEERKAITQDSVEIAIQEVNPEDKVIVVFNENIPESIAGIVAGRIKERFYKPTVVLTRSGRFIKGSARSIEVYNLFDELTKCRTLFEKFGGHAMAAGLTMVPENMEILKKCLNENCELEPNDFQEIIRIEKELLLDDITFELAEELQILAPYGKGNSEPLFGTKAVSPSDIRLNKDERTLSLKFAIGNNGRALKAVYFNAVDSFKEKLRAKYDEYETDKIIGGVLRGSNLTMDIVYSISINTYMGNQSVQIQIKDCRL